MGEARSTQGRDKNGIPSSNHEAHKLIDNITVAIVVSVYQCKLNLPLITSAFRVIFLVLSCKEYSTYVAVFVFKLLTTFHMSKSQHLISHRHKTEAAEDFSRPTCYCKSYKKITVKVAGFPKTRFHMQCINNFRTLQ